MSAPDTTRTAASTAGLVVAARKIAQKRAELLSRMRSALESNNLAAAIELARQLCGVPASQKARVQ